MSLDATPSRLPFVRTERRQVAAAGGTRLAPLRAPLAAKIVGANLLVVAILAGARITTGGSLGAAGFGLLTVAVAVHFVLVLIALRPIRDLEDVAARVWGGDHGARVERSAVADAHVLRVGSMFNILLDGLASDRAHMRRLASDVIAAADRERAAIARELHDSTAQHVAALLFQLSAAARDATNPQLASRLLDARDAAENILEQVRLLSHTVHSAVLDNLGLEAALRTLARDAAAGSGIDFDVSVPPAAVRLPRNVEAVLYRVAEEAIRNTVHHSSATLVLLTLRFAAAATLEVRDDGAGFDADAVGRRDGGLATMRERLALVDGWLEIDTAIGNGTTITAMVPLGAAPASTH
ncbi:MAG TPA: histidine kinase [Gemmatimonadaceae bacterium]